MPKIPIGVSLSQEGEGFVLRRKPPNGRVSTMKLTQEEFLSLKGTIDLWSDRLLSQSPVASGSVSPIIVYPVAQVSARPDALQNVLLTVRGRSDEEMTLLFPPDVAQAAVAVISDVLSEISNPLTRQ
jgi:hypothetical protein